MSTAKRVDQEGSLNSLKEIQNHLSIYFNSCYQELLGVACSRQFVMLEGQYPGRVAVRTSGGRESFKAATRRLPSKPPTWS
jgi:hypothetical protein